MSRQDFAQKRRRGNNAASPHHKHKDVNNKSKVASKAASKSNTNPDTEALPPLQVGRVFLTVILFFGLIYILAHLIGRGPAEEIITTEEPRPVRPTLSQEDRVVDNAAPLDNLANPSDSNNTDSRELITLPLPLPVREAPQVTPAPSIETPDSEVANSATPAEPPPSRFDFYDILPQNQVQGLDGVYVSTPRPPPPPASQPSTSNNQNRNTSSAGSNQSTGSTANNNEQSAAINQSQVVRQLFQVASFRTETDAEQLRIQLIMNGLPNPHIAIADTDNGRFFRVRTGPFPVNQAERARSQLRSMGINSPLAINLN